jgi:predicted Zn finger-like uncharacterized protein
MLIVCPSCATSYDVELASLHPDGRRVRCVRCRHVWHAEPSRADQLMAAAEAIAPGQETLLPPKSLAENQMESFGATNERVGETIEGEIIPVPEDAFQAESLETPSEIQVDAPPISPIDLDEGSPAIDIEASQSTEQQPEDIESYAARHDSAGKGRWRWPLSALQSGVIALLIIDAVLVGWRDQFVRMMPQTASFYSMLGLNVNLRGLAFDSVATATEQHEGVPILVVEGNIVNDSHKVADIPRLKFAVCNGSGQEVYSWSAVAPRTSLSPGESVAFRSRLASPPVEAHDVLVRFITRQDIISGAH